jgi:RNA recognition motif-containing protein
MEHDLVVWLTGVSTELKGIKVKVIRNKFSRAPDGYGFIEFEDEDTAASFLDEHNGKPLPVPETSASPSDLVFRLNWAAHGVKTITSKFYSFLCIV